MDIRPEYLVEQSNAPISRFDPARQRSDEPSTIWYDASETPIGYDATDCAVDPAIHALPTAVDSDQAAYRECCKGLDATVCQPAERRRSRKRRPTYIDRTTDRSGRQHLYFRRRRGARIPLRGEEGTPDFEASYRIAQRIDALFWRISKRKLPTRRTLEGVAAGYFKSDLFATLAPATRVTYQRAIQHLVAHETLSGVPVRKLGPAHMRRLLRSRVGMPAAQSDALKKLRLLFRVAIASGWCTRDPTETIPLPRGNQRAAWTAAEVATFEARWPVGTRERLAFDLLRRAELRGHTIVTITIDQLTWWNIPPAHPKQPRRKQSATVDLHAYALTTERDRPFSAAGFGKFMARAIADADLPVRCVADSLRRSLSGNGGNP